MTRMLFNKRQVGRAVLCTPRLEADARTLAHEVRRARSDAPYLFVLSVQSAVNSISTQHSVLLFLAEFLEGGIAAQRIPDRIEPKKGRRDGEWLNPARIGCL